MRYEQPKLRPCEASAEGSCVFVGSGASRFTCTHGDKVDEGVCSAGGGNWFECADGIGAGDAPIGCEVGTKAGETCAEGNSP